MAKQESNIAILYADVIDASRTRSPSNDGAMSAAARVYLAIFKPIVTAHAGRVINTAGDGLMYAFPDANAAVLAACEMQAHTKHDQSDAARHLSIRIGLHYGAQITAGVVAQRMAVMAQCGQIITTSETKALLSVPQKNTIRQHVLPARSKPETVTVHEIVWHDASEETQMPSGFAAIVSHKGTPSLRLIHGGREIIVVDKITFGRLSDHDVVLRDRMASRIHAVIERRNKEFVLIDQSTFGTFVKLNNTDEQKIQRAEIVLRDSGIISFGRPLGEECVELISFWRGPDNVVKSKTSSRAARKPKPAKAE
jgi:adenylate cyclase